MAPRAALVRRVNPETEFLAIAPWLSPSTRDALREAGYSYLDLTGNVRYYQRRPPAIVQLAGEARDPRAPRQARQQLRGVRAGRLVRLPVDVTPPYRATELAAVSGVSLPYVSRLLGALEEEALVTRSKKVVVEVDWPRLLQERARQYSLLGSNSYTAALARGGVPAALDRLREGRATVEEHGQLAITGSVAAEEVEPATVGGQLVVYLSNSPGAVDGLVRGLGLTRTSVGANVLLVEASDPVVFARTREVDGLPHVAFSQLALDCLSGPGRMPAEGEAVLEYMRRHESMWRARNLDEVRPVAPL